MKTIVLDLPTTPDELQTTLREILLSGAKKAILNFETFQLTIVEPAVDINLDEEIKSDINSQVQFLLNKIRIFESEQSEYINVNEKALLTLVNELLLLSGMNYYPVAWLVHDSDELKEWLQLPKIIQLKFLFGIPVYSSQYVPPSVILLGGSKRNSGTLNSILTLRKINMEVNHGQKEN